LLLPSQQLSPFKIKTNLAASSSESIFSSNAIFVSKNSPNGFFSSKFYEKNIAFYAKRHKADLGQEQWRYLDNCILNVKSPPTAATSPEATSLASSKRISLVALGCPKNTVDAEVMLGDLMSHGYQVVDDPNESDLVIVNTCAFVEEAKAESIEAILEAAMLKKSGRVKGVVVTGCLAQRYSSELALEMPEIDGVVGFAHYSELPATVSRILQKTEQKRRKKASTSEGDRVAVGAATVPFRSEWDRKRLTPPHYAFLRVAEGCDHTCSFCAIPSFRGKFRSKPWENILDEAKRLADSGVTELNLIAEDTNQWGIDFGPSDKRRLADLLEALSAIDGISWIRILYAYPSYFSKELIDAIANLPKVAKYIDIPLQHISDKVLKAMNRPSAKQTIDLLTKLRAQIPGLALRTTFISGFPGETEKDHQTLVNFAKEFRFERMGAFSYSEEDGTSAALLKDLMLPMEVREARRDELTALQQQISFDFAKAQVGKRLPVLIERLVPSDDGVSLNALGRTQYDAPDIDCVVDVALSHVDHAVSVGDIVECEITGSLDADLFAEPVRA